MPVGKAAVPELMATAEQREMMYHKIREYRQTKPLFTVDFWNDGEYVGGCIAGGRSYCHINANGDIEPCAFIHYSDSNIREKTLLEAYRSPLFMAITTTSPGMRTCFAPVRYWTIREGDGDRGKEPCQEHGPIRIWRLQRSFPTNAWMWLRMGAGGRQALGGFSRRLCCLRRVQKGLGRIITGKGREFFRT